ncbi:MAG: hypothetical protein QME48_05220 [bacterium]|uniref:Glycosyl transferase family protein n=2 Tax=Bacteria candidate phyla TaxID=1783234 RepID=A0A101I329_UNCT6|nr:MAG: glycosyl transferase family protein [candidate division TA06 bacterium 32_111]KUK87856.1 MAG: glycosyl transferase family protein [candidate division TA06 bacterium 34_109]MDI6700615.1 hypothetical protein [bacterium]HAF08008.1 hypothetical protein [candidate division WOR-3 bacterium]HCP16290.1 hypothetical protein [candidate division WOR-3 bacterium]
MDRFTLIVPIYSNVFEDQIRIFLSENIGDVIVVLTKEIDFSLNDDRVKVFKLYGAGYGKAVNYASKFTKKDYLIITNDDILFEADLFKRIKCLKDDIVVPLVKDKNKKDIESFGSKILFFYNILNKNINFDKRKLHLTGSFFIIKREIFENIRGFDEKYFMYYEDIDLSVRLKRRWKILFDENMVVFHKHSSSDLKNKRYFLQRNRLYFVLKNFDFKNLVLFAFIMIFVEPFVMAFQILKEKSFLPFKARYDFFKGMKNFLRK